MKNGTAIIYTVIGILVILGGGWAYGKWVAPLTKDKAIDIILEHNPTANKSSLQKMGLDWLLGRAEALRSGKETFMLNGKAYVTKTGKAV